MRLLSSGEEMVLEFSSVSMLVGALFNAIALLIYCKVRNLDGKSIEGGSQGSLSQSPPDEVPLFVHWQCGEGSAPPAG